MPLIWEQLVCFPEEFVPGYRLGPHIVAPPDSDFLQHAWHEIALAKAKTTVIFGTERYVEYGLRITCLVLNPDGSIQGWQDKVQLDPSEDDIFTPGNDRHLLHADELSFGIAICHEGWRYPETVCSCAFQDAHLVFHPHHHWAEPGSYSPGTFADPANTFLKKRCSAVLRKTPAMSHA